MSSQHTCGTSNSDVASRKKVAIVQPYVPAYRSEFFASVQSHLNAREIDMVVWQTGISFEQAARGDAIEAPWLENIGQVLRVGISKAKLTFSLSPKKLSDVDCVVLPLEGTSLDIPMALFMMRWAGGPRVFLWGHVKNYVSSGSRLDSALESFYMRRADHVYAYTDSGAAWAIRQGVAGDKVTSLHNTVDTSAITQAMSMTDQSRYVAEYDIDPSCTFSYIGGLDRSKRVDFLARALDVLWALSPEIRVLVAGEGADAHLLNAAVERNQVIRLGRVDAVGKAEMARSSIAMIMPGRVGLVAVDALAMGLPVLTTNWEFHAPEYDYLEPGDSLFVSDNTEESFAHLMLSYVQNRPSSNVPQAPSLDNMVGRFCNGITQGLQKA